MGSDGPGPRFLLIPGFAQNRLAFTLGSLPRLLLERGASVSIGELRGHGRSDPSRGHTLEDHLDLDLPALIDAVGPPVHLVGHSMGGMLGYALLGRGAPLASLTVLAAPLVPGGGRLLLRIAAAVLGPLATSLDPVPMHAFLEALAKPLSERGPAFPARMLQRVTRLASPSHADPRAIQAILSSADPESPAVLRHLATLPLVHRRTIGGVELSGAVRSSTIPIAAIVGTEDVFGGPRSVRALEEGAQAGPRLVLPIEGATHVDITIGDHLETTVPRLWGFWFGDAKGGTRTPTS